MPRRSASAKVYIIVRNIRLIELPYMYINTTANKARTMAMIVVDDMCVQVVVIKQKNSQNHAV